MKKLESFPLKRCAAIDIGTVTCRMLVADCDTDEHGCFRARQVAKKYLVTNLGEGVDATHRLSPQAIARVSAAIDTFLEALSKLGEEREVAQLEVVATSAARDAENASEFAEMLAAKGLDCAVIPGTREAALSFAGATGAYPGRQVCVVDVGGGSTEIAQGRGGDSPVCSHSFNIGCRRVTERFWDGYPPTAQAISRARAWMRPQLETWFASVGGCEVQKRDAGEAQEDDAGKAQVRDADKLQKGNLTAIQARDAGEAQPASAPEVTQALVIAVAGTATSAVAMRDAVDPYDPRRVDGAFVSRADLAALTDKLAAMTLPELESVVGLDPRRAPVICAGMVILDEVLQAAGAGGFVASEHDILDGMIMYACTKA